MENDARGGRKAKSWEGFAPYAKELTMSAEKVFDFNRFNGLEVLNLFCIGDPFESLKNVLVLLSFKDMYTYIPSVNMRGTRLEIGRLMIRLLQNPGPELGSSAIKVLGPGRAWR